MRNTSDKSGVATVHAVMLGTFMSGMDINVVNMVLPVMQNSFHTAISAIAFAVNVIFGYCCSTDQRSNLRSI